MLFVLLLFCCRTSSQDVGYKLTPINGTGFHYEYQSNLNFVVNTWSFVLNVQYAVLRDRVTQLNKMSLGLKKNLDAGGALANCSWDDGGGYKRELDYVVDRKITNLFETHNNIEYLLLHKRIPERRRHRRGLFGGAFNFIGRFYKYTVGVMDDKDAELLYDVANQANNTEYRVKTLTTETLKISEYLESIRHGLEDVVNCHYLERQLVYIKDNLEEIETTYEKIVAGIQMALYSGRLSSMILNPSALVTEMAKVDSNAWDRESEWVVIPRLEDMHTVMRLVRCNVFINPKNELMFVIQVPRVDRTKFALYRTVSVPQCDGRNVCKFLTPGSQYIGFQTRAESKHYVRLDDISTCTTIDDKTLCFDSVTSEKVEYSTDCDVLMFRGFGHDKCEVRATRFHTEIFHNLNNVNRWLFMVGTRSVYAGLNCGSGRFDGRVTLRGTGIITLTKYCKLRTSRSILTSKHVQNYDVDNFTVVHFNFSRFVLPPAYNLGNEVVKSLDYDTLTEVTRDLKKLVTAEEADAVIAAAEADDNSNADWYSNLFGNWWWEVKFVIYAVCILVGIIITLNVKRACCGDGCCLATTQPTVLKVLSPR